MEAFSQLVDRFPELRLLLVGCFEDGDPLPVTTRKALEAHSRRDFRRGCTGQRLLNYSRLPMS